MSTVKTELRTEKRRGNGDTKRDGVRETGAAAKVRRIKGRKPKTRIAKREKQKKKRTAKVKKRKAKNKSESKSKSKKQKAKSKKQKAR